MPIIILKTDNGTHTAAQWAEVTASHLIEIAESAGPFAAAGHRLRADMIDALVKLYQGLQSDIRARKINLGKHRADAAKVILALGRGTPFEAHFKRADVIEYVSQVIGNHFATANKVEADARKLKGAA